MAEQVTQAAPSSASPPPELVAFLSEPMNVSAEFVRGAVEHGLVRRLPDIQPDGDDFVTGEFPIFFVRAVGRLLQLKFMPLPYFAEQCRPFVNGDPDLLAPAVRGRDLKKAVRDHQAWLAVSLMNSHEAEDGYLYVGAMMSALLVVAEPLAIVWPSENQIRLWDYEMLEALDAGNPLRVFG